MINYKSIVTKTELGKNGKPKKTRDAAFFYCPYIPLMTSGVVLDGSWIKDEANKATEIPITIKFNTQYGQSKD